MTSASQKKATRISQKLTLLKDQGDRLIGAVGQYVSEIVAAGESWMEGEDNKMEYVDLCQTIEAAAEFLWERCEELSDAPACVSANRLSQPCSEQADPILHPETATSYRQPATSQTSTAATSNRQTTPILQPAGEIQLTAVLARIAVIEEALCSFRGKAEIVAEQQSGLDQHLKEVVLKLTESDKKNNSRFRKMKEQVKEQISEIKKQVSLGSEHETRLQSLEKQLEKLSIKQDRMEVEMTSQTELSEKLVHVPVQLESVKGNFNVLEARIDRIIDDSSNKDQKIENVMRDLADKVVANTDTDKTISERQDKTHDLLAELETRFQKLEAESDKAETNLTQVIQDVAELKSFRTRCGFTAETLLLGQVAGDTIKQYAPPHTNVGENFNLRSGIFTAPVDGLYVTSVSLRLVEDGEVIVRVYYNEQGQGQSSGKVVCWVKSTVKGTTACSMRVVDMKAGDTLSTYLGTGETSNMDTVWFSCFLLA